MVAELNEILKILRSKNGSSRSANSLSITYPWEDDASLGSNRMRIIAPDGYYFSYIGQNTGSSRRVVIEAETGYETSIPVSDFNKSNIVTSNCIIDNGSNAGAVQVVISLL